MGTQYYERRNTKVGTTSRVKTWISGDTLTAADLNAEFNNILNGGVNSISDANIASNAAIAVSKIATGLSGSLVGTTDTQTLTNKNLTTPKIGSTILDSNGNVMESFTATASAVDYFGFINAATGGTPTVQMTATGSDTNIHMQVSAKGSGLVKKSVLRQDITTNAYKHNSVILTGWGYKASAAAQTDSQAVTFGITFNAVPIVICSSAGGKSGGAPTVFGDLVTSDYGVNVFSLSCLTTGFTASAGSLSIDGNNPGNLNTAIANWGYSWIAVGEFT